MIKEENGQIIVTELRPMIEYPAIPDGKLCVFVLVFFGLLGYPNSRWMSSS